MDIIERLNTEEEKYQIIRFSLEKVDKSRLGTMARIINNIEHSYGRLAGDSENRNERITS